MRKFKINVNGNSYEVEVEEVTSGASSAPVSMPASKPTSNPNVTAPKKSAPTGAVLISAPMPGTILDIKVTEGDTVKKGDTLLILEAMKMENEITAPQDGTVASVQTSKGSSVNTGDALVSLS
jgi:glutaconyl-CoA/methylmalonyl-CoA decarboxylase subunit gamma